MTTAKKSYSYEPFTVHGSRKAEPTWGLPGTRSISVNYAEARRMIDRFNKQGHSAHSCMSSTLWVLIVWCQTHEIDYVLEAAPGRAYIIKRASFPHFIR